MEAQEIAQEIVVFDGPYGLFSNDPRWHDPAVRKAWEVRQKQIEAGENPDEVDEEEIEEELPPYSEWTNEALRAELVERKLSVDGKKIDMVARLEEDDAKDEA